MMPKLGKARRTNVKWRFKEVAMIDLLSQVDEYCERTSFELLSEPLNLFSNLFFWVAAVLAIWEIRRRSMPRKGFLWLLVLLVFMVGLGSGLFHSLATRWAKICDVAFIGIFVVAFLWGWARQVMRITLGTSLKFLGLFFVISAIFYFIFLRLPVNGSQGYFGVAFFLFVLGLQQTWQLSRSRTLTRTAWVFVASLACRTWDEQLCAVWPYGTHFLWHSLNAVVCYLSIRAMAEELEWQEGYRGP
jgi:hypothetical protein